MKRFFLYTVVILLLFAFSGCTKESAPAGLDVPALVNGQNQVGKAQNPVKKKIEPQNLNAPGDDKKDGKDDKDKKEKEEELVDFPAEEVPL